MPETMETVPAPPRAIAYRLASAAFSYPDAAWEARFKALLAAARERGTPGKAILAGLEESLKKAGLEGLAAQNFRLFGSAPACPLELAFHLTKEPYGQAKKIADFAGFFSAFGVQAEGRADHLPAILEFMAYLEVKQSYASLKGWTEQSEVSREAAEKLGADLLRKALSSFEEKLRKVAAPDFYLKAAALCRILLGGVQ